MDITVQRRTRWFKARVVVRGDLSELHTAPVTVEIYEIAFNGVPHCVGLNYDQYFMHEAIRLIADAADPYADLSAFKKQAYDTGTAVIDSIELDRSILRKEDVILLD